MAKTRRTALVNKEYRKLSIKRQCALLDLPLRCYYYEPAKESERNLLLMCQIDELHLKYPFYGVMRMWWALSKPECPLNNNRISRLMQKLGIETLYPKRNLSKPCK